MGERRSARFVVACTGFGSKPYIPDIAGMDAFSGVCVHTGLWPQEGLDLSGKRVAVVGTGASGVQVIQEAGREAAHLTVFQRTPNTALAMQQKPIDTATQEAWKPTYPALFAERDASDGGMYDMDPDMRATCEVSDAEREKVFEAAWQKGGFQFWIPFSDTLSDERANRLTYDFWRAKVLPRINDPKLAEKLAPGRAAASVRRQTTLGSSSGITRCSTRTTSAWLIWRRTPIEAISPTGIRTTSGEHNLDIIILATGFDAGTGGLTEIDFRDTAGRRLAGHLARAAADPAGHRHSGLPQSAIGLRPSESQRLLERTDGLRGSGGLGHRMFESHA